MNIAKMTLILMVLSNLAHSAEPNRQPGPVTAFIVREAKANKELQVLFASIDKDDSIKDAIKRKYPGLSRSTLRTCVWNEKRSLMENEGAKILEKHFPGADHHISLDIQISRSYDAKCCWGWFR